MSLIKKPSQLDVTPTLIALVYGQPGVGKSTLACSAPAPVLFDFDGGAARIDGAYQVDTVQVHSWEEAQAALKEVREAGVYKTIIIDTVGKMMLFIEDFIKRTQPTMVQRDGTLSLKGYGVRKTIFSAFNNEVRATGLHIVYVAHEIEQKRTEGKKEITVKRPEVGGKSTNDLMKELDLVGYMQSYDGYRTITFDPSEEYYGKNVCGMYGHIQVDNLIDDEGCMSGNNDFMQRVIAAYEAKLQLNKQLTAKYEALCALIRENVSQISCADDANVFTKWIAGVDHIYNSKVVAQKEFAAKVAQLSLSYDKINKTYSDAQPVA